MVAIIRGEVCGSGMGEEIKSALKLIKKHSETINKVAVTILLTRRNCFCYISRKYGIFAEAKLDSL